MRSALRARANLWWTAHRHQAHLVPARRSNAERCLHWAAGNTTTEIGHLLTASPVRISGARFTPPATTHDVGLIHLGDRILELKGPSRAYGRPLG